MPIVQARSQAADQELPSQAFAMLVTVTPPVGKFPAPYT